MRVDTLILGGGPVGCTLACALADMGVSALVIERDKEPYKLPRAIVMDDEIQRAMHDHGMGDWLEANTSRLERGDFLAPEDTVAIGGDIPELGLQGVPPVVCHYQPELDAMLRAELQRRGAAARWGRTVVDMVDRGDRVVATLDDGEMIESRWFVGCDGASSWTRRHVGLSLEDLRFDQEWLVVDVELNDDATVELPLGVRQYCRTDRPTTYVKGHRRFRRWEFQVQPGEDSAQLNTESGLWGLLAEWVTPHDARLVRSAVYRFHAVVAPEMRKGNVFLAGDSAHQTPPFAGQGLNSGMRDAFNLAWKMGWVTRGRASDRLLDTYASERVPHVRATVGAAIDMGLLIDQLAGRVSHGVDIDAGYGGRRLAPVLAEGFVVPGDDRVGHQFWHQPEVSRALVEDPAALVIVAADEIEVPVVLTRLGARVVVAPAALGGSFAVVVRPDRYVAAVANDAAHLADVAATLASRA
ncbi:MAG: FAD-dependent monooxygenase [Ilumatobacteraceae bacterium]